MRRTLFEDVHEDFRASFRTFLQREVGWVFQAPGLLPYLTAVENVALSLELRGVAEREAWEETGALDSMLSKIAEFYEDQVGAAVKSLTSILEPVMIILVGGMVGFIVVAMYMPLFKVYDQIR